jgi:hypothetical protein
MKWREKQVGDLSRACLRSNSRRCLGNRVVLDGERRRLYKNAGERVDFLDELQRKEGRKDNKSMKQRK